MALPRSSGRSRFPLFILLLTSVTLLSLDARNFGPVERLKDGIAAVVSPFRSVGDTVFGPVGDAWSSFRDSDDLEAENEQLRRQIDELLSERVDNADAADQLAELRTMLDLEGTGGFATVVAEVTAGSVSNFDPYVLEIDKGSTDGIADDMPVITAGGLVGRIEDTRPNSARVRLITDPEVSVGVLIVDTDEVGIVSGGGIDEPLRVRDGVPVGVDVEPGAVLVTSGLDRSPYPEGLAVGVVEEVIIDEGALSLELVVAPTGQFERLDFVTVVLYDPDAAAAVDDGEAG